MSGDAWERECTAENRKRFEELYFEFFPEKKIKEEIEASKNIYCEECDRTIPAEFYKSHCESKKHKRNVEIEEVFKKYSISCEQRLEVFNTCRFDSSKFCIRNNCRKLGFWVKSEKEKNEST